PGEPGAQDRPGNRGRGADGEQRPVDAARQVPEDAGDAEAEADRDVRPDGPEGIGADEPEQRADPERTEDQTDEAAEQSDQRTAEQRRLDAQVPVVVAVGVRSRTQQVYPENEQRDPAREPERGPRAAA